MGRFTRGSLEDADGLDVALMWAKRFVAGCVIFTSLAIFYYLVDPTNRTGPPPYAREDLRLLRQDPLMNYRPDSVTFETEEQEIGFYGGIWGDPRQEPTTYSQWFELHEEPGRTLGAFRQAAEKSGWSVTKRECLPERIRLGVEKNFEDFFVWGWIDAGVWGDSQKRGRLSIDAYIDHRHSGIQPLSQEDDPTCMEDLWREYVASLAGQPRSPESDRLSH